LPFYAILRAIPNKAAGVAAMGLSLVILFFIPFVSAIPNAVGARGLRFRNLSKVFF
jgi:ubiquinol-cytochrome c reductase cytochrome b subunit